MRSLASTAEAGGTYIGAGYTRVIGAVLLDNRRGRFIAAGVEALFADLVNVGGQIHLG